MESFNDYVIVDDVKVKKKEHKTDGGLYIPDAVAKDIRYKRAEIVIENAKIPQLKKNDIIVYDKAAGHQVTINGRVLKVIRLRDIVLKV